MRRKSKIKAGDVFGRLTIISGITTIKNGNYYLPCRCTCGVTVLAKGGDLRKGKVISCGCSKKDSPHAYKHGAWRSPEYIAWTSMKKRCNNLNDPAYKNYGGRGIKVTEKWEKFENFLKDVGKRPSPLHTLERIDNNGNYEPSNVKWATRDEQARNRRGIKVITYKGKTQCLKDWADELGVKYISLWSRLNKGWSVEKSLTTPY